MILRRLSQSIKEQNWTAIVIEFVLLVSGVFLGIQVSNWNAQRVTDKQSEIFTQRLRADLRNEARSYLSLNKYYDEVFVNAEKALAALEGKSELSNEALIIAAYRATQYSEAVRSTATYDELTSTGNIGLIKDAALRETAANVYNNNAFENIKAEGINSRYRSVFRMLMPVPVQYAIAKACGDRTTNVDNIDDLENTLDYPCETGLAVEDIDAAAALLRSDTALIPLLRLRIIDAKSQVSLVNVLSANSRKNLETLAREKP